MNINRYNYEEYLMLYIDGELSLAEKQQVESFLQQNPDVKEELELLQQTVLQPEAVVFKSKESLYRKESGINLSNCQQYFLLYVDNELTAEEKQAVETFVLQHPDLQDEFTLLKQTVLPAENIVFSNKEQLYRKEHKRRPVVINMNYRWVSLAAAVMIGVVALIWIFNSNNSTSIGKDGVAVKPHTDKKSIETAPVQPSPAEVILPIENDALTATLPAQQQPRMILVKEEDEQRDSRDYLAIGNHYNVPVENHQQKTVTITPPARTSPGNNITVPQIDNYSVSADENYTTTASNTTSNDRNITQQAVLKEELITDDNENTVLVGSMQLNKNKLRGFFRKAGRMFSNKEKSDDGKLQIANMEINSSLK